MYESSASQDGLEKEASGNTDVEIAPTVSGRWSDKRRHTTHQHLHWVFLLLATMCLVFLSACDTLGLSGASGAHSPTATPGLSGTLAAAATAQAAASASDHPTSVFYVEKTGAQGEVLALNPANGSVKWRTKILTGTVGVGPLQQSQGLVLVTVSGRTIMALDAQDGTERWHIELAGGGENDYLVVDGNTFYVNSLIGPGTRTTVSAYQITDGTLLWHYDTPGNCGPTYVAAASGIVVLSTVGCYPAMQITALSERDGSVVWQHPANDVGSEIAIANNTVYLNSVGLVTALDAVTGATKWRHTPAQLVSQGGSSTSVSDQMVTAEASKTLLALRPQDGSVTWSVDFPGFISGHIIVGNVVYVTDYDTGSVTALRLSDGGRLWQITLDLPNPFAPVVANGILYVSAYKQAAPPNGIEIDKLYAIQTADGSVAWQHTATGN